MEEEEEGRSCRSNQGEGIKILILRAMAMQKQGFLKMAGLYFVNFFSIVFRGKPATRGYTDVR